MASSHRPCEGGAVSLSDRFGVSSHPGPPGRATSRPCPTRDTHRRDLKRAARNYPQLPEDDIHFSRKQVPGVAAEGTPRTPRRHVHPAPRTSGDHHPVSQPAS